MCSPSAPPDRCLRHRRVRVGRGARVCRVGPHKRVRCHRRQVQLDAVGGRDRASRLAGSDRVRSHEGSIGTQVNDAWGCEEGRERERENNVRYVISSRQLQSDHHQQLTLLVHVRSFEHVGHGATGVGIGVAVRSGEGGHQVGWWWWWPLRAVRAMVTCMRPRVEVEVRPVRGTGAVELKLARVARVYKGQKERR